MNKYKVRLPSGLTKDMELEQEEAEYWISVGMFLNHGLHAIMTVFAAEQMGEEEDSEIPESLELADEPSDITLN